MGNSQASWSADGSELPPIDPHTKAKHQILEEYIENLIITLCGQARYGERTFTFVDAFCGGGMYDDKENGVHWQGSPARIINAVRKGYDKSRRKYQLNVKYIFVDKNKNHLDCLKNYSMLEACLGELVDGQQHKFSTELGSLLEQCEFICNDFEKVVAHCQNVAKSRKGHSFFLLDPFGWSHVSMSSIRSINAIAGSEILYTYMINHLKRFVIGKQGKHTVKFNKLMEAEGYYESVNLKMLDEPGEQRYLRNESLRLFREKGRTRYAHTFSLIPKKFTLVLYYLMHFSQNITALQVMRNTLWHYNNLHHLFEFEVYGFGLKTVDYYKRHEQKLDFCIEGTLENHENCILTLDRDLRELIHRNDEGISFAQLCDNTMEKTPATKGHYEDYIKRLWKDKEIEILRKGSILPHRKTDLQKKDIIRATGNKQLYLF